MTALIDLDIILYRCLFATDDQNYPAQLRSCDNTVYEVLARLKPENFKLVLTGKDNFRYKVYPAYKANRVGKPKPENLHDCQQYFIKHWDAIITQGYEADDYIAMNHKEGDVIVSTDKDFMTVGGLIYNWVKNEMMDVKNPMFHFWVQMLTGDDADNIPGVLNPVKAHHKTPPNFTLTTATAELQKYNEEDLKDVVTSIYEAAYKDEWYERFDINGQLLWLKRSEEDQYYLHF